MLSNARTVLNPPPTKAVSSPRHLTCGGVAASGCGQAGAALVRALAGAAKVCPLRPFTRLPTAPGRQATGAPVDIPEPSLDLARSEAFYHGLFDLSPDGVVVTNSTGIILKANPRAAELMEFDGPEAMVGLDAVELYVHPEQRLVLLEQVTQRHHIEGSRK